jgi:formylglycine-generating enzyme required for sulfatase activity/energy-coupling factor transporter ATP-binding protein EcfA2
LEKHTDALITGVLGFLAAILVAYFTRRSKPKEVKIAEAVKKVERKVDDAHRDEVEIRSAKELEQRYLASVRKEHGELALIGFQRSANVSVNTMELFVSLRLSREWRDELRADQIKMEDGQPLTPKQALRQAFGGRRRRLLLVLGEPGSGKTTLLKFFAMRCLEDDGWRQLGLNGPVFPMIVPLHEVDPDQNVSGALSAWASKKFKDYPADLFDDWLEKSGMLVMLDGLDEISDEDRRRRVCKWIDAAANYYVHSFFVVTSRHSGYKPDKGIVLTSSHFRANVLYFDKTQQELFLKKWFTAAYKDDLEKPGQNLERQEDELERQATEVAGAVVKYLWREENERLRQISGTPIMLQIMAILWKEYGHLATRRADLYEQCITYLLDRRDRILRTEPLLPAKDAMKVLRPLCLWMQEHHGTEEVAAKELEAQIKGPLENEKPGLKPSDFIINLCDRAGLLQEFGDDHFIFRHRSFREYLAALEFASQVPRQPKRVKTLVENFKDDWWREVLLFALSLPEPTIFDDFFAAFLPHKFNGEGFAVLIQHIISEARGKSTKSFESFVLDQQHHWQKRHNALHCLRLIANAPAKALVKKVWESEKDERLKEKAGEILREWQLLKPQDIVIELEPVRLKWKVPPVTVSQTSSRFFNPHELNSEYILIPGAKEKIVFKSTGKPAPDDPLYFAKYPVTNKLYRRFIDYLAGASREEALPRLPLEQFAQSLLAKAAREKIVGFTKYLDKDLRKWADNLRSIYDDDKRFNGDDQPVVGVAWFAAVAYCHWLTEMQNANAKMKNEKLMFRLPTEEEWEWAASGGKREYPWGPEKPDDTRANYGEKVGHTTPVSAYPAGATPEGLMDMAGNVWEWMENPHPKYKEARALRGGSWDVAAELLRCVARYDDRPDFQWNRSGFRVVRAQS